MYAHARNSCSYEYMQKKLIKEKENLNLFLDNTNINLDNCLIEELLKSDLSNESKTKIMYHKMMRELLSINKSINFNIDIRYIYDKFIRMRLYISNNKFIEVLTMNGDLNSGLVLNIYEAKMNFQERLDYYQEKILCIKQLWQQEKMNHQDYFITVNFYKKLIEQMDTYDKVRDYVCNLITRSIINKYNLSFNNAKEIYLGDEVVEERLDISLYIKINKKII